MARLRAAGESSPSRGARKPILADTEETAGKSRFGINSLINRMTGHSEHQSQSSMGSSSIAETEASEGYELEDGGSEANDRIEIPAFLRRQAN